MAFRDSLNLYLQTFLCQICIFTFVIYLSYFFNSNIDYDVLGKIILISISIQYLYLSKINLENILSIPIFSFLLIFVVYLFGGLVEIQPDGMTAHLEAINLLRNKWNIAYEVGYPGMTDDVSRSLNDNYIRLVAGRTPYIMQSILSGVFEVNEGGRSLAFILTFCFLIDFTITFSKLKYKYLIGFIIVLCPINIGFLYSHYVDHLLYLFLIIYFLNLYKILSLKSLNAVYLNILLSFIISGLKANGFLIVNLTLISCVAYIFIYENERLKTLKDNLFIKNLPVLFLASLIGTLSPLGMNYFIFNDPFVFFNSYGGFENAINIVWGPQKEWFLNNNVVVRLIHSIFSQTSVNPEVVPNLKFPLFIMSSELNHIFALNSDARIGGFGPYFGAIIILSLLCLIFLIIRDRKVHPLIFFSFFILILTLVNPFSFWARFVPYLWIFPILISVHLILSSKSSLQTITGFILVSMMYINSLTYFVVFNAGYLRAQSIVQTEIAALKSDKTYKINFRNYDSIKIKFIEDNINFVSVSECESLSFRLHRTGVDICK